MLNFSMMGAFDLDRAWQSFKGRTDISPASDRDAFYRGSYPYILAHFRQCEFDGSKADCGLFWQALILVYSWMGRGILTSFEEPLQRYRQECGRIRTIRQTGELTLQDLNSLVKLCNGSLIATSKFLHFLKPEAFAIWDSRVCAAIFDGRAYYHDLKSAMNYLSYLNWIRPLRISTETTADVCSVLQIDPEIGALRAKEYILFVAGAPAKGQYP